MGILELYIAGSILANAVYLKRLMNREIKEAEEESRAVHQAISGISSIVKNN
ncbi:MAG: hypothetical protein GXO65_03620 [Euryarchaeota archaeon]|nr:hypothetical protein [Euryarchaeota archaeon]